MSKMHLAPHLALPLCVFALLATGASCAAREAGPGTDFHALERGVVSVTPLQVDLTHANQIPLISAWIVK